MGKWAKACDQWSEEYGIDSAWKVWSASFIIDALNYDRPAQAHCVEVAGMHLRTWRKSLDPDNDLTGRQPDPPEGIEQERLLWMALACIAYAAGSGLPVWTARNLRQAEAHLRTWWKRELEAGDER